MKKSFISIIIIIAASLTGCDDMLNGLYDDITDGQQVVLADSSVNSTKQDGRTWETAFNNIQDAVNCAYNKRIPVVWAAGTFEHSGTNETPVLTLRQGITVYGGFTGYGGGSGKQESTLEERNTTITVNEVDPTDSANYGTIISANTKFDGMYDGSSSYAYHVVTAPSSANGACLDGIAVTRGYADGGSNYNSGAGLYNQASISVKNCVFSKNIANSEGGALHNDDESTKNLNLSPNFDKCKFYNNVSGSQAGAVYNDNCISVTYKNSYFYYNKGTAGAGMYNNGTPSVILTNCWFTGNATVTGGASNNGGGMLNTTSIVRLNDCHFINNISVVSGGGIYNTTNSSLILSHCSFNGNEATTDGAGIYCGNSSLEISNCDIIDNIAQNAGGGLYCTGSGLSMTNCTYTNNTGNGYGGGMLIDNTNDIIKISNCIINKNKAYSAGNGGGIYLTGNNANVYITNCLISYNTGSVFYLGIDYPIFVTNTTFVKNNDEILAFTTLNFDIHFYNCIEYGNLGTTLVDNSSYEVRYSHIQTTSASSTGYNNVGSTLENISFSDYDNDLYTLTSDSTCINTGNNEQYTDIVSGPVLDLGGSTRLKGTIDRGAYEFQ